MIDWVTMVSLKKAAKASGVPYKTLHRWASMGVLPGAIKRMGTRWFIPQKTLELIKSGELDVRAFDDDN